MISLVKITRLYKLLCIFLFSLCLVMGRGQDVYAESVADRLTHQGFAAMEQQQYADAIELWQEAEAHYRRQGAREGLLGVQVNQAIAMDELGLKRLACKTASDALGFPNICESEQPFSLSSETIETASPAYKLGLNFLGSILTSIGHFQEASTIITLLLTETNNEQALLLKLTLNGQIISSILHRNDFTPNTLESGKIATLLQHSNEVFTALIESESSIKDTARVNYLRLTSLIYQTQLEDLYTLLLPVSLADINLENSPTQTIINLLDSLIRIEASHHPPPLSIEDLLSYATIQEHSPSEKAALLYLTGQWLQLQHPASSTDRAYNLYEQAALLAEAQNDAVLAYKSRWQMAKIPHPHHQAISLYEEAIKALDTARQTIEIFPSTLAQLDHDISDIFHEYMELLSEQGLPIIEPHTEMRRYEIESYIRCTSSPDTLDLDVNSDPSAARIHIVLLKHQAKTIINHQGVTTEYSANKQDTNPGHQ